MNDLFFHKMLFEHTLEFVTNSCVLLNRFFLRFFNSFDDLHLVLHIFFFVLGYNVRFFFYDKDEKRLFSQGIDKNNVAFSSFF